MTPARHRLPEHAPLTVALALLVAIVAALAVALVTASDRGDAAEHVRTDGRRTIGYGQIAWAGAGPERWAQRWRQSERLLDASRARVRQLETALHRQRRILLGRPHVVEAINLTCAVYGYCATLWRRARCETGGTFSARAYNATSGASGLFQFLPSTWRSTPFARFSVWSPIANALAAGWMHANGRGGEWSCPW